MTVLLPGYSPDYIRPASVIANSFNVYDLLGTVYGKSSDLRVADKDFYEAFNELCKLEKDRGFEYIRSEVFDVIGMMKENHLQYHLQVLCLEGFN
jgi:hypothetical protein